MADVVVRGIGLPARLVQQLPGFVRVVGVGYIIVLVHPGTRGQGRVRPVGHAHVNGIGDGVKVDGVANGFPDLRIVQRERVGAVIQQQRFQLAGAVGDVQVGQARLILPGGSGTGNGRVHAVVFIVGNQFPVGGAEGYADFLHLRFALPPFFIGGQQQLTGRHEFIHLVGAGAHGHGGLHLIPGQHGEGEGEIHAVIGALHGNLQGIGAVDRHAADDILQLIVLAPALLGKAQDLVDGGLHVVGRAGRAVVEHGVRAQADGPMLAVGGVIAFLG